MRRKKIRSNKLSSQKIDLPNGLLGKGDFKEVMLSCEKSIFYVINAKCFYEPERKYNKLMIY